MSDLCPVKNFIRPDKPHECTYLKSLESGSSIKSPHHHEVKPERRSDIPLNSALEMVGNTPLIKMNNLAKDLGLKCNLYAKCEFYNPGGSVKDRIGVRMVEEAERAGFLKPGDYVIEPTSGNTGIGLALTCAVRGYKCIIVMPEKMSKEKNDVLKALGATIIRTPTSAAFDAPNSHISEAQRIKERLNQERPGCAHILDQYTNAYNPIAHYDNTGEEIVRQVGGKLDLIVATAGTGGTICGLARKIKEKCPKSIVVGVDPVGSILAEPNNLNDFEGPGFYEVEGIGYDFLPTVLDRKQVDYWYKSVDRESFQMARKLINREGLLCGGSCGSAMYCAIESIKKFNIGEGQNVVVLLPDSIRNYMTKYLSDDWMVTRGFMDVPNNSNDPWWFHKTISELQGQLKPIQDHIVDEKTTMAEAIQRLKEKQIDVLLSFQNGRLKNVITKKKIMEKLVNSLAKPTDSVLKASLDRFILLKSNDKLKRLQSSLDSEGYAVVVKENETSIFEPAIENMFGIPTSDNFLEYISKSSA